MSPLIPIGAGLAAIAYFALSSKSASAATSPYPSAPGGGGGGGSGGGGGGGGGTTPSSPSAPSDGGGGAPYVDPTGTGVFPNQNPSGYVGPGVGTTSPTDSGGLPGAVSSGTDAGSSWTDSLASMFSAGGPSVGQGVDMGWHFSQHPNVMAVTGGRGGWVPNYDGCAEGYAPPGGLPIH